MGTCYRGSRHQFSDVTRAIGAEPEHKVKGAPRLTPRIHAQLAGFCMRVCMVGFAREGEKKQRMGGERGKRRRRRIMLLFGLGSKGEKDWREGREGRRSHQQKLACLLPRPSSFLQKRRESLHLYKSCSSGRANGRAGISIKVSPSHIH